MTDTQRQKLWPFTTRLVNSRSDKKTTEARYYRVVDWICRDLTSFELEDKGFTKESSRIQELSPIVDKETAKETYELLTEIPYTIGSPFKIFPAIIKSRAQLALEVFNHGIRPNYHIDLSSLNFRKYSSEEGISKIVQMRIDLLDELCPEAPMPDDALTCRIEEELEQLALPIEHNYTSV